MAVIEVIKENFEEEVLKSDVPVIADFYATWCGPCKMTRPILEEIANERQDVKIVAINVDEEDELAEDYEISSIPCLVVFKDGKEATRSIGFRPKEEIENMIG